MFQSEIFRRTFATITDVPLELYTTDGAEGAARAAGVGAGIYSTEAAFRGLSKEQEIEPDTRARAATVEAYERWKAITTTSTAQLS